MIRLYTSLYPEREPTRQAELLECLRCNLACPSIDSVYLLLERIDEPPFRHENLTCRKIDRRPTYRQFFDWCNENVQSDQDFSIVANSDIHFDSALTQLTDAMTSNHCAALARWDVQANGKARLLDRNDSQDSWIFRGFIRSFDCDYHVGIPRCDNRILYELNRAGYDVINPAFSIRSFHLHQGDRGEYVQRQLQHFVDPPYAYLWPHNLIACPKLIAYNLAHPLDQIRWRFDRRWLNATLPIRAVYKLARLLGKRS